jgi:hypothetical protein
LEIFFALTAFYIRGMNLLKAISTAQIVEDPKAFVGLLRERAIVNISDVGYTVAPTTEAGGRLPDDLHELLMEAEEAEDMASVRRDISGIANTIFISGGRHAARIKVAIDPPDSLNAWGKNTSVALHDYSIQGQNLPAALFEDVKAFIDLNREVLLAFWNCEIDTRQALDRLRSIR